MSDNPLYDLFMAAFDTQAEDAKALANTLKILYDAYIYVGFTEEQAMELTKTMLSSSVHANKRAEK